MGIRERDNFRAFLREEAEREEAEQAERERPIREAQEQLVQVSSELAKLERERVAGVNGLKDEQSWADPILAGTRMQKDEAKAYNAAQFQVFMRDNPDAYLSPANSDALFDYLTRNDTLIATAETYRRAYARLAEYGLLEERPAPESEPTPELEPPPQPEVFEGIDLSTGEPHTYTAYEVNRMDADTYVRAFKLNRVRAFIAK